MKRCSTEGCPGEYVDRDITHTVRDHGDLVVIEGVPAEVCTVCGDTLLSRETVLQLEDVLKARARPTKTAPVYDFKDRRAVG